MFDHDALEEIADKAIERKIGARGLRAVMEGLLMNVMYDIPSDRTIDRVTITPGCVQGTEQPKISHRTEKEGEAPQPSLPLARGERVCSVRAALFAPRETVPAAQSLGRVCGAPTVGCPPAIPIAVSGEQIGPEALELFRRYGVEQVEVLR